MPINYFDTVFSKIAYDQNIPYVFHRHRYDKIPNDCDSIGITFWDGDFNEHMELINTLLPKTKKLLIFAPEPVWPDEFVNFVSGKAELFPSNVGTQQHVGINISIWELMGFITAFLCFPLPSK